MEDDLWLQVKKEIKAELEDGSPRTEVKMKEEISGNFHQRLPFDLRRHAEDNVEKRPKHAQAQ